MKVGLTIFPTFSDKSIPLGIASINGALRAAGHDVRAYDLDFLLSVESPELYYQVHAYAWQGDSHVVNYLGGTDVELVLRTVFFEEGWLGDLRTRDPGKAEHVGLIRSFVQSAVERILADDPDEVWFSTFVSNFWLSMVAAQAIRKTAPHVLIGFGGPAVFTEEVRRFLLLNGIVDHCFVGEGEITAVEYAGCGVRVPGMATLVDGAVAYEPRPLAKHLADLPPPDFTGLPLPGRDIRAYLGREFTGLPVFFSRGCVQKCAFCAERKIWHRFRTRTPEAIVEQLTQYQQKYGIALFYSCDSLVNFTERWLEELCDRILEAGLECAFSFAFAIGKRLPARLSEKMARAGFTRVYIGAEHGAQPMLDRMNKGTDADEVIQVAVDAVMAGLSVQLGTIVNFPGETTQDVLDEIRVFRGIDESLIARGVPTELLPRRSLDNPFRLEPGTAMMDAPEEYGVVLSGLTNPLDRGLPGLEEVLMRWDYAEPQDAGFHRYLASRFGNLPERWVVPAHLSMRMAQGLRDFISDDDTFRFRDGVGVSRDTTEPPSVRVGGRILPLTRMLHAILIAVTSGDPLWQVRASLSGRYSVRPEMLHKFVALFFLERVLDFRDIAPLPAWPGPGRVDDTGSTLAKGRLRDTG